MRAAIYNPYLDTLGGGERYTLSFAEVLAELGWQVDLEWRDEAIKSVFETRFGMDLSKIHIVPSIKRGDRYDLCFWVSDGSIPTLYARKNFLHFQVPFHDVKGRSLLNKMKLFRVDKIICNSLFTKKVVDEEYGVESVVVYPPVPTVQIKPKRKEDMILSVGRFSSLLQNKKQDILVRVFKKMTAEDFAGWKLVLAGGIEVGADEFVEKLGKMAEDYPVEIIKSPDFNTFKDLYGKAKVFWSASGFGEDEIKNPQKVEHFGISVVEAMAAGTIPVVYNGGGHKEIIEDGKTGFLWDNVRELTKKTKQAVKGRTVLAKNAAEMSKKYSYDEFRKNISKIL